MKEITTTAIVGMGALGMLYGDLIMEHLGTESVCFVADPEFPIADSREAVAVDLVIVAVKYNALQSALDTMKNCVGPDTTIISVMNGITSEEIIGERFGAKKLVHTIAQGMDAVKFGGALNYTKPGEPCRHCLYRRAGYSLPALGQIHAEYRHQPDLHGPGNRLRRSPGAGEAL